MMLDAVVDGYGVMGLGRGLLLQKRESVRVNRDGLCQRTDQHDVVHRQGRKARRSHGLAWLSGQTGG